MKAMSTIRIVRFSLLAASLSVGSLALAQTVTVTTTDETRYELSKIDNFDVKRNADNKTVTVRLKLDFYFLHPDLVAYPSFDTRPKTDRAREFDGDILAESEDAGIVRKQLEETKQSLTAIRPFYEIPSDVKSDLKDRLLFPFGDILSNYQRTLQLLAQSGENFRFPVDLPPGIKLISYSQQNKKDADLYPLDGEELRNKAHWTFKSFPIKVSDQNAQLVSSNLFEVKVTWILEATFDPVKPPPIPLKVGVLASKSLPEDDTSSQITESKETTTVAFKFLRGNVEDGNRDRGRAFPRTSRRVRRSKSDSRLSLSAIG
jgi:hypothetical protein